MTSSTWEYITKYKIADIASAINKLPNRPKSPDGIQGGVVSPHEYRVWVRHDDNSTSYVAGSHRFEVGIINEMLNGGIEISIIGFNSKDLIALLYPHNISEIVERELGPAQE